jgi:DDE domain
MAQPRLHHPTATRATAVLPSASALVLSGMTGRLARRSEASPPWLVPRRRDKTAAKQFFHKLLKGLRDVPRVIVTDTRRSDATATRERRPNKEGRRRPHLNGTQ